MKSLLIIVTILTSSFAMANENKNLIIAKTAINFYVSTLSEKVSDKETCFFAGSARTALTILDFSSLSPSEQASILGRSVKELGQIRKQVAEDDKECTR